MTETSDVLHDMPLPVNIRRGIFVALQDGAAVIDMADSRFVADFGSGHVPMPGDAVVVVSAHGRHLMFPGRPLPGVGTVLTVTSGMVRVNTTIGEFTMPHVGAAPTSGDLVGVSWSEQPYVVGKLSVQPVAPAPIPDPSVGVVRSATFMPTDTGSTDRDKSRWWQAQPWASNTTFGAWFYGDQIRNTIPAGASFVSVEFFVAWQQRQGGAPRFALHNLPTKTGVPSMGAYTQWNPNAGWQTPPMAQAWFDGLKAGGGSYGVGLNKGGYNRFSSRAQNAMSGALRISWRS